METVSVIVPTYDRTDLIIRALSSIISQTYDSLEIIIIDDHSPIPVREVIESSEIEVDSIKIHRHNSNMGGNAARKTGIELASGKYVAFLDDDDEWNKTKIEKQIQRLNETGAGVIYTGVIQVNNGVTTAVKTPNITGDVTTDLLTGNFIGTFSTILMRQDLINIVGYPDEDLKSWHDWDYYLRLSEKTTIETVSEPLVRRHSDGQEQLSHDHSIKRDATIPRFLHKHRQRAEKYNLTSEFEATVAAELGWSATVNNKFKEARSHYARSMMKHPTKNAMILLALTIGGRWTFRPAQIMKRMLINIIN